MTEIIVIVAVAQNNAIFIIFRLGFMGGFDTILRRTFSSLFLRLGRSSSESRPFISLRNPSFEPSPYLTIQRIGPGIDTAGLVPGQDEKIDRLLWFPTHLVVITQL